MHNLMDQTLLTKKYIHGTKSFKNIPCVSFKVIKLQWGSKYGTPTYHTYLNARLFCVPISNGPIVQIPSV